MAESPTHKWGQIIGEVLEAAISTPLQQFASEHNLFLDRGGPRPARPNATAISWKDKDGNTHDLDFVLERGGTPNVIGTPVAFIETAWRRYTKHSKNKAQEIQGAVLPLVATYSKSAPFYGAILAGEFTNGAITQLKSLGFAVMYFPYRAVLEAFRRVGLDASSEEDSSDTEVSRKIEQWEALSPQQQTLVSTTLISIKQSEFSDFMRRLETAVNRRIASVRVLPLHGVPAEYLSVQDAIRFIETYQETPHQSPLVRYEVQVLYNNSDKIQGEFSSKGEAIQFLEKLLRTD
jgi:hypothetical protein